MQWVVLRGSAILGVSLGGMRITGVFLAGSFDEFVNLEAVLTGLFGDGEALALHVLAPSATVPLHGGNNELWTFVGADIP